MLFRSAILREHIETVIGHYRGRVYAWDVVNEAIDDQGGLRQTFWSNILGSDYIAQAFTLESLIEQAIDGPTRTRSRCSAS